RARLPKIASSLPMASSCSARIISLIPSSLPAPVPACLSAPGFADWLAPDDFAPPGWGESAPASALAESEDWSPCLRLSSGRPSRGFPDCCLPELPDCGFIIDSRLDIESLNLLSMLDSPFGGPDCASADAFFFCSRPSRSRGEDELGSDPAWLSPDDSCSCCAA